MSVVADGTLIELSGKPYIQWEIDDFFTKLRKRNDEWYSPYFCRLGSSWYLQITSSETESSIGWISLYLCKGDLNVQKLVHFALGILDSNGQVHEKCDFKYLFVEKDYGWGTNKFLKQSELRDRLDELVPSGILTITCAVKSCADDYIEEILDNSDTDSEFYCKSSAIRNEGFDTLRRHLKQFLFSSQNYDVTIKVKERLFRAHKDFLQARSPVFASMFNHNMKENNTGTVFIEDIEADDFEEFLKYVYTGEVDNLSVSNVFGLYYASDKYDFSDLKKMCVLFMKTHLSTSVICDVICLSTKHSETELLESATQFFLVNTEEILLTTEWQHFLRENTLEANQLYIKALKKSYSRMK